MSNSSQALYSYFSGFGITAYKNTQVPENVEFPFLTYDEYISGFGTTSSLTVNLWYRGEGEAAANAKARQIFDNLGVGGKLISFDDGAVWLKRGSPFCQSISDDNDKTIKRRYINISCEFITRK